MNKENTKDVDVNKVAYALSLTEKNAIAKDFCPNEFCGYKGEFIRERKGYLFLMIFLFFYGILPGVFYWIAHRGYNYYCPKCNGKINK